MDRAREADKGLLVQTVGEDVCQKLLRPKWKHEAVYKTDLNGNGGNCRY